MVRCDVGFGEGSKFGEGSNGLRKDMELLFSSFWGGNLLGGFLSAAGDIALTADVGLFFVMSAQLGPDLGADAPLTIPGSFAVTFVTS